MMNTLTRKTFHKAQRGAILIVSLVILLVITLLGTAAIQSTSLELKMAKNVEERQAVFQHTEAALRRIENIIEAAAPTKTVLDSDICAASSAELKKSCFDDQCTGGYCFWGTNNTAVQSACEVVTGTPSATATLGNPSTFPIWESSHHLNVWANSTRHKVLPEIKGTDIKYIVEFQCFIDGIGGREVASDFGEALYRITVLGDNNNLKVMLQSTYAVDAD